MRTAVPEPKEGALVLGIDPGFAHLGWAVIRLRRDGEELVSLGVFRTEKSDKKRGVLGSDDNVRRTRAIAAVLSELVPGARLACAESMTCLRNAGATAKLHLAWGALVATLERFSVPLAQASPQEVKLAACGRKDAGKDEVLRAMRRRFGRAFDARLANVEPAGIREHAVDALAVVVACLPSELARLARPRA